jgi:hypothetical protein
MESLQKLKNVKKKTTAVADVDEQAAATNAIADAARTTSAADVAATAAVSDEAEKTARNESITTRNSEANLVARSREVNIPDKDAGIDGESGDKAAAETAGNAGDMWQDEHTKRVLQEEKKHCFKETQSSNLRNFQTALEEILPLNKTSSIGYFRSQNLSKEEKDIVMDNILYNMARVMRDNYVTYLLLFPSHKVIIGKYFQTVGKIDRVFLTLFYTCGLRIFFYM